MNKKRNIRIAFIGAGRVAEHYNYILKSENINCYQIVGICDINIKSAEKIAKIWDCPIFNNIPELITKTNPDLSLVLTPSGLHYEHTKEVLNLDCNVLVEKPVSMIPSQAEELDELSKSKNLLLCVAFQNRLNPAIQCLKRAIDLERFGQITTATIRLRWCRYQKYYQDDWHGTWKDDGGVINQQAIHHVDALNWLLGPVESVCATITNRLNKLEAEDTVVSIVKFKNGSLGTIEATTAARPIDIEASISVIGEKGLAVIGGIALNNIEQWKFNDELEEDSYIPNKYSTEVPNGYGLSHGTLIQSIINKLLSGYKEAPIPVEDCIATTELIHAIYSSHETDGWVHLKDKPVSKKLGKQKHVN